jgi:hypothetical protein
MIKTYPPISQFVYDEISKVKYTPKNRDNYHGEIGEILVEYAVKWFFWKRCFKIDNSGNNTFYPRIHYGANPITKQGGIDLYLIFRYNGKTYRIYIEVKNWDDQVFYPFPNVSNHRFKNEILKRYVRYGKAKSGKRVLVIPKGYISNIQSRCNQNQITIIPLCNYIIYELLGISFIYSILNHFYKDFTDYIDGIIKIPISQSKYKSKKQYILDFYDKGMPLDLIAKEGECRIGYVYKVISQAKKR